ncbi:MAG: HPP family protein [Thiogranum sp.]
MSKHPDSPWLRLLGVELSPVSHTERVISAIGGFLGIYGILQVSSAFVGPLAAALIVASMGASAVLLFAVPHGPLSQPWPVIGGHLVSAVIGVSCAKLVPDTLLAAALAVALAIGVMHYLRCIHPPGGASALAAVVGGESVHAMGYQFVITPVLLNVLVIVTVAVLFNYPFAWRRYPAGLKKKAGSADEPQLQARSSISHEDLVYALHEVDSFIDVSEQDLLAIYRLATRRSAASRFRPGDLRAGHCYSNGKYGSQWSVRRIVDESGAADDPESMLIYKVMAGDGRRTSGVATRQEFADWAKHEVYRDDENWHRVDPQGDNGAG